MLEDLPAPPAPPDCAGEPEEVVPAPPAPPAPPPPPPVALPDAPKLPEPPLFRYPVIPSEREPTAKAAWSYPPPPCDPKFGPPEATGRFVEFVPPPPPP